MTHTHSPISLKSLREQVYIFLKEQLNAGLLSPGSYIDQDRLAAALGISRTPLREAMLQLAAEGFVTIQPRRGIIVNELTIDEIRHLYEVIGALEAAALLSVADQVDEEVIAIMRQANVQMRQGLDDGDFSAYYRHNLIYHNAFLDLTDNAMLRRTVTIMKERLYDFPRPSSFIPEWEYRSLEEHNQVIIALERGDVHAAADSLRDVHWSFKIQEPYIRQYYHARA
jgi:DNA-binding GntR family transcriptional regulator